MQLLQARKTARENECGCYLWQKSKSYKKKSEKYDEDIFGKDIDIQEMSKEELKVFITNIKGMHTRLLSKPSLGVMWKILNREWITTLQKVRYNGDSLPIEKNILKLIIDKFELDEMRVECARYWNQLMQQAEFKTFFELDKEKPERIAKNFIPEIRKYLDWYSTNYSPLKEVLSELHISEDALFGFSPLDSDVQKTDKIFNIIYSDLPSLVEGCKYLCCTQKIEHVLNVKKEELSIGSRVKSTACENIQIALNKKDPSAYRNAYRNFCQLYEKMSVLLERRKLLQTLAIYAPSWAYAIETRLDIHGKSEVPNHIEEAWKWKQFVSILEELSSKDYSEIQQEIEELTTRYHQLTTNYIVVRAKFYLVTKMNSNPKLRASLKAYSQTVKKIGKTVTARSIQMKQQARKLIAECQHAVPVWIMTISNALSTLSPKNNRFDIVIIDEASQADISALAIPFMARKLIVVGDEKQVSPEGIGVPNSVVDNLVLQHLGKIKHAKSLYTQDTSLYDIARYAYEPRMLMEHFRCMPNIIGFSNHHFYDGKIKPLRDASTSVLLPHVVNYHVKNSTNDRYRNYAEVKTVVALMQACIEQPEYEGKTFGAISMYGHEQSGLIENLISEKISRQERASRKILCGEPPNFQGDERDVIFISLVHGPDPDGGPLILTTADAHSYRQGKRYNVATSRAKDQLWVVHSLDEVNDLQKGDIRRELIEFAKNPKSIVNDAAAVLNTTESPFEKEVAEALIAKGYNIKSQWTVGAYRIDFVVIYQDKMVALECDGDHYHSSEEAIRSDMERQQILERLGWRFIRLRGSEYYHNKEKAIANIVAILERLGIHPENSKTQEGSSDSSKSDLIQRIKIRVATLLQEWDASPSEEINMNDCCDEILRAAESPFEKEVAEALINRGYNIQLQYPDGAYRIDIVVFYQNQKIALECDGTKYHSSEQDVQMDLVRQRVLEEAGWKFIRLNDSNYYQDKEKAINHVIEQLNQSEIFPEQKDFQNNVAQSTESTHPQEQLLLNNSSKGFEKKSPVSPKNKSTKDKTTTKTSKKVKTHSKSKSKKTTTK